MRDELAEPVEVVDQDRAAAARREVEEPLELAADPGDVGLERLAIEQVALRSSGPTDRRSCRSRRRRGRPAGRRSAGAGAARRSDEMADVERGGGRVEAVVAGDRTAAWPGGPAARASWRAGCRATRARRASPSARPPRRSVTGLSVEPSRPEARRGRPLDRSFTLPMLSCGHRCRPASRGASATDGRSSVAPRGRDRIRHRSDPPRPPRRLILLGGLLAGAGAVVAVGAYNYYAAGLPDPVAALTNIPFEQQTVIYDRTGKIELARLGDLKRELVTFDQLPGEIIDATTAIEDKDFWVNPGFDPAGIVSAGLDTISGKPARRLDHHPAARPRPAPAAGGVRGHHLRAQGARDHPVDPPDPGLPGRGGQAGDHHRLPQPELLRQPELRREGRGQGLLRQVARPS